VGSGSRGIQYAEPAPLQNRVASTAKNETPRQAASPSNAPSAAIHLEAEDARLAGTTVSTTRPGFSGKGYVTGFDQDGDKIEFTIRNAKAGLYEVRLRYSVPQGEKGYDLVVNGSKFSNMLARSGETFTSSTPTKVELQAGANTIAVEKGWGYYDIDAIDIVPVTVEMALKKPPKTLVDGRATARTRALHAYLIDLYGQKTLSGQHEQSEFSYIRDVTGKTPAILGGDLIEYSPSRVANGAKPEGTTERFIEAARAGHIVTMAWHWNAPKDLINQEKFVNAKGQTVNALWWRGFYTEATTFDVEKALANPHSEDHKLLLRDIDVIAVELKKFAAADVPILWRPLHEAEGGWFWWGAKGPKPLVQLWRLMFDRLTNHHNLHNLIWVFTGTANMAWYPGDGYVDIIGVDSYPTDPADPLSSIWDDLKKQFDGKKLLALSEFGGVPDVEKARRYGVRWSYFMSWTGDVGPHKMTREALARIYQQSTVLNKDELKAVVVRSAKPK
jgi:mannan endo-1,4-beta-mannosidase